MTHRDLDIAREHIRQAEYGEALELLTRLLPGSDEIAHQCSRFTLLEKQRRLGMMDNAEYQKQCALLTAGLLQTIDNLRQTALEPTSDNKPTAVQKETTPPTSEDMGEKLHIRTDHENAFDFLLNQSNRLTDGYEKSLRWDWEILTDLHQAGEALTDLAEALRELETWLSQRNQTLTELYELVSIGLGLVEKAEADYLKLLVHNAQVGATLRAKTNALQKNISEIVRQLHVKLQIASASGSARPEEN